MQSDVLTSFLPLIALFAIFYFLVFRPQQKQAKQHKEMINNLKKGDKIVNQGGFILEVFKVEENFFRVKLSDELTAKITKEHVLRKLEDESKL